MTAQEYSAYEANVAAFLRDNCVKPGCHGPHCTDDGEDIIEPFFSWCPCECCKRPLGGNRETYQFATEEHGLFDADICPDCVYYLTYGELDDTVSIIQAD